MKTGLIQIYTGNGKGKTTASLGLALRAIGHSLKVCYISFNKEPERWGCGEFKILEKLKIAIHCFAKKHPHFYKNQTKKDTKNACCESLNEIGKIMKNKKYDIVILDEILSTLYNGYLNENEILGLISKKPAQTELILTGRGITKKLIKKADLVSEVKKIKHPYDKGIHARKGIEF